MRHSPPLVGPPITYRTSQELFIGQARQERVGPPSGLGTHPLLPVAVVADNHRYRILCAVGRLAPQANGHHGSPVASLRAHLRLRPWNLQPEVIVLLTEGGRLHQEARPKKK